NSAPRLIESTVDLAMTPNLQLVAMDAEMFSEQKCFVCCTCTNAIGTKSFIPKEQDIYCAKCYEDKFATKCIKCSK
ncbi:Four and a half LIM domains protein 2, partial [Caligus rogercresseyi]